MIATESARKTMRTLTAPAITGCAFANCKMLPTSELCGLSACICGLAVLTALLNIGTLVVPCRKRHWSATPNTWSLPVDLTQHNVNGPNNRHHVRDQVTFDHS